MWIAFLLCALLSLLAGSLPGNCQVPRWRLTFSEEFSGHRLNTRLWTPSVGTFQVGEHPLHVFRPRNVGLTNGFLRIRTEQQNNKHFYSGEIRTFHKFAQTYGKFVVRCRYSNVPGMWSAVYLLPESNAWPPEIDITEHIGRLPQTLFLTQHWQDAYGQRQMENFNWQYAPEDWTQWHVYTVDWEPESLCWYVDGVLRGKSTTHIPDVPMYLRVNTAVGGIFAETPRRDFTPQHFDVDYIRVYQRDDHPREAITAIDNPPHAAPQAPIGFSEKPGVPSVTTLRPETPVFPFGFDLYLAILWLSALLRKNARVRLLALAVGGSAIQYLAWRIQIIQWQTAWIAVPLFIAELLGLLQTLGFQYTLWPHREPALHPEIDPALLPVFIFIPTVNEGVAILRPTIMGALAAREHYLAAFPDASVTIIVCNDGYVAGVTEWQETETLASELGVQCVTRRIGGGAKAGNLEYARQTVGAVGNSLVVIFDADQIASPEFLTQTIAPFADPAIGWVQTGQYYRNLENNVARWANDQQSLFYRLLCPGKSALNAAFICGTNVVIRARALDEIGGLPQDSLTEDYAASLRLHGRWRSLFLSDILAQGLGPVDLPGYFAQQRRWATGTLETLRTHAQLLFSSPKGGLSPAQRGQYLLASTHYLSGLWNLIYLVAPLIYVFWGVSSVTSIDPLMLTLYFLPYWLLSQWAVWQRVGIGVCLRSQAIGFASFPVLVQSLWDVLLGRKQAFAVTAKTRRSVNVWQSLRPQLVCVSLCFLALWSALILNAPSALLTVAASWLAYSAALLGSVIWLGVTDAGDPSPL